MATLGLTTNGANTLGGSAGLLAVTRSTLATGGTLNELHGWFSFGSGGGTTIRVVIYKHTSGADPTGATLVAYTNPLTLTGATLDLNQTGFSVALPAADYWIGCYVVTVGGGGFGAKGTNGAPFNFFINSISDPPPSTMPTVVSSGNPALSCWAVYSTASVPVADFTGTPTSGTASLSVTFTDSSTNTPTSWAWTFGDGGTSTSQNPSHSYTTSGVYTVTLQATNSAGSNTKTRTAYITVGETISYAAGGGVFIY